MVISEHQAPPRMNSKLLKGGYLGVFFRVPITGVFRGDTTSLDYSSYTPNSIVLLIGDPVALKP